jgi:hypothetical protein
MQITKRFKLEDDRVSFSNYVGTRDEIRRLINAVRNNDESAKYIRKIGIGLAWTRYNEFRQQVINAKARIKNK